MSVLGLVAMGGVQRVQQVFVQADCTRNRNLATELPHSLYLGLARAECQVGRAGRYLQKYPSLEETVLLGPSFDFGKNPSSFALLNYLLLHPPPVMHPKVPVLAEVHWSFSSP